MASEEEPALLEALFIYGKADILDKASKRALRLCNTKLKNLVDATVVEARVTNSDNLSDYLIALINTEWHGLKKLSITERGSDPNRLTELPSALFVKFSRLETLEIYGCRYLKALPEEIGELSNLKSLEINWCDTLVGLPTSLGKLTTLEKIFLKACNELTTEGIASLQYLTGLTALTLAYCDKLRNYPEFICNLTSLKTLHLSSTYIETLPDALGNLTNLETLGIYLQNLKQLPKSIGNFNALKDLHIISHKPTTLPESLDDLLWRKAHETGGSKMRQVVFSSALRSKISPKMKQALELLGQNGVIVPYQ